MSILIKGMDKPTDCGLCPFEDFGYCNVKGERNTSESGIDTDCPLIEVADRKTEPNCSEIPNNCEHITEDGVTCAKYPACDDCLDNPLNKVKGSERLVKGLEQTEPTISKMEQVDKDINVRSKDEPNCQECKHFHENAVMYLDQCDFCFKDCNYEPMDEPQTDCAWK